jgi:signal peptidase I
MGRIPPWALRWLVLPLVLILVLHSFAFGTFHVAGESMRDTLEPGDFLLVSKLAVSGAKISGLLGAPTVPVQRGDVVVFRLPKNPSLVLVKRVIGVPGDRVRIQEGRLSVSEATDRGGGTPASAAGARLEEAGTKGDFDGVVPNDSVFVVGDNRSAGASSDSREWGYLPAGFIVGKAVARLLPLQHARLLTPRDRG